MPETARVKAGRAPKHRSAGPVRSRPGGFLATGLLAKLKPVTKMVNPVARMVRDGAPGLLGQCLNFVVMMLPILAGRLSEVAFLVVAGAVANILLHVSTLSFASIYPSLPRERSVLAVTSSALSLAAWTAAGLVLALLLALSGASWAEYVGWAAALLFAQGAYVILVSRLIRLADYRLYSRMRLAYGSLNLCATGLVCLLPVWEPLMALSAMAVYAGVAGLMSLRLGIRRAHLLSLMPRDLTLIRSYVKETFKASTGVLLSTLAFQASSFTIPFAGPYALLWASVLRVGGGFVTLNSQVVAPIFEMRMAARIRDPVPGGNRRELRTAVLSGLGVAVPAAAVSVGAAMWSGRITDEPTAGIATFGAAAALYCLAIMTPIVILQFMVLLGGHLHYLVWSIIKLCIAAAVVMIFRDIWLIVAFAAAETVMAASYILIVRSLAIGRKQAKEGELVQELNLAH